MYRLPAIAVLAAVVALCSTGCATLLRGDKQRMKFQSNAPDAVATIDGKKHSLPAQVELLRKEPHEVVVSAPGYQSICFELRAQWDGASLPNLAPPGGSVLFAIDTMTGADRKFYTLATINLDKCDTDAATQPVTMYEFRGKVMDKRGYDRSKRELQEFHHEQAFGGTY